MMTSSRIPDVCKDNAESTQHKESETKTREKEREKKKKKSREMRVKLRGGLGGFFGYTHMRVS